MGAAIGDFSIVASKKVGKNGKVIALEPNPDDFELLKENIKKNDCDNTIPLNLGVARERGEREITFYGKTFRFKVDTLENILKELDIEDKVDFIKMDIEGFEVDVVTSSINTIKEADAISVELHGIEAKRKVDEVLLSNGFTFKPITMGYVYGKLIRSLFSIPVFCLRYILILLENIQVYCTKQLLDLT